MYVFNIHTYNVDVYNPTPVVFGTYYVGTYSIEMHSAAGTCKRKDGI